MSNDMRTIAERIKAEHSSKATDEEESTTEEKVVNDEKVETSEEKSEGTSDFEEETPNSIDEDDEVALFMGDGSSDFKEDGDHISEEQEGDDILLGDSGSFSDPDFEITDDELYDAMSKLPREEAEKHFNAIRMEVSDYRRNLIIKRGLPAEEADILVLNKIQSLGDTENVKYLKDHPEKLTVVVDKTNAAELEFTPEEKAKMTKAKVINLEVVEDVTIKETKIKKLDSRFKNNYIDNMDSSLSTYSVPLPLLHDFVKFRGTQLVQIANTAMFDDVSIDEALSRKANLIYNQMVNGVHFRKTNEKGKPVLSYSEFIKVFPYMDIPMAIYGILVASSMEKVEVPLTCGDCGKPFDWTYNTKELLNAEEMSEEYKDKFEDILENKANEEYLKKAYEENSKTRIVKSPITGNLYYIDTPSVARALAVFRNAAEDDTLTQYYSSIALFMSRILLPDKGSSGGEYIAVEENEQDLIMKVLRNLPEEEASLLTKYIRPMFFEPRFTIKSVCEHCGQVMKNDVDVDRMVLLSARDSFTAMTR